MKKLGAIVKEVSEKKIKSTIKDAGNFFVVRYTKLSSPDLSSLRLSLRGTNASFFVVKNSVARRALKDSGFESLLTFIDGPCGLVFVKDDPISVSKVLCDFAKTHEPLKFPGGFMQDRVLEQKDIEALAKLPSQDVLRAQLVMTLNSPISKLAMVLNQTLKKFVYCLEQVKNKKGS